MTKIVDVKGQEILSRFVGKECDLDQRVQFLEVAIECRVQALLKQIDPTHVTSANVVNKRLNIPLKCHNDLEQLKLRNRLSLGALERIQNQLFGQL